MFFEIFLLICFKHYHSFPVYVGLLERSFSKILKDNIKIIGLGVNTVYIGVLDY